MRSATWRELTREWRSCRTRSPGWPASWPGSRCGTRTMLRRRQTSRWVPSTILHLLWGNVGGGYKIVQHHLMSRLWKFAKMNPSVTTLWIPGHNVNLFGCPVTAAVLHSDAIHSVFWFYNTLVICLGRGRCQLGTTHKPLLGVVSAPE